MKKILFLFTFLLISNNVSVIANTIYPSSLAESDIVYSQMKYIDTSPFKYLYVPTQKGIHSFYINYSFSIKLGYNHGLLTDIPFKNLIVNKADKTAYKIIAITDAANSDSLLLKTNNNGSLYKYCTLDFAVSGNNTTLDRLDSYLLYYDRVFKDEDYPKKVFVSASGENNGLYYSGDFGDSWECVFSSPVNFFICSKERSYDERFLLVCYDDSIGLSHVALSHDDGNTWKHIYESERKFTDAVICDSCICLYGKGFYSTSIDFGNTWVENENGVEFCDMTTNLNGTLLYALETSDTLSKIWHSTDMGLSFHEWASIPAEVSDNIVDIELGYYIDFLFARTKNNQIYYILTTNADNIQYIGNATDIASPKYDESTETDTLFYDLRGNRIIKPERGIYKKTVVNII